MWTRPLWNPSARQRHGLRWALMLLVMLAAAALAYANRIDLHDVTRTFSTVRDSSRDAALVAKVKGALALSRKVAGFKIDVVARSGVVTLGSRVPSPEARSIVEAIVADTPGVGAVQNGLEVDPRAVANGYETTLLERISDLETQVAIQERLRREPRLTGANVEVERGVVVLRGWVNDDLERASARRIAQAAVGAEQMRDELQTANPTRGGEDRLARRVEFGSFDWRLRPVGRSCGERGWQGVPHRDGAFGG